MSHRQQALLHETAKFKTQLSRHMTDASQMTGVL